MLDKVLFNKSLSRLEIDPNGKIYDNVSRYLFVDDYSSLKLDVDICKEDMTEVLDRVEVQIYELTGSPDFEELLESPQVKYQDYVTYGTVFEIKNNRDGNSSGKTVYVSFGGLLMKIQGEEKDVSHFEMDQDVIMGIKTS